jgi:hypothetical protein
MEITTTGTKQHYVYFRMKEILERFVNFYYLDGLTETSLIDCNGNTTQTHFVSTDSTMAGTITCNVNIFNDEVKFTIFNTSLIKSVLKSVKKPEITLGKKTTTLGLGLPNFLMIKEGRIKSTAVLAIPDVAPKALIPKKSKPLFSMVVDNQLMSDIFNYHNILKCDYFTFQLNSKNTVSIVFGENVKRLDDRVSIETDVTTDQELQKIHFFLKNFISTLKINKDMDEVVIHMYENYMSVQAKDSQFENIYYLKRKVE